MMHEAESLQKKEAMQMAKAARRAFRALNAVCLPMLPCWSPCRQGRRGPISDLPPLFPCLCMHNAPPTNDGDAFSLVFTLCLLFIMAVLHCHLPLRAVRLAWYEFVAMRSCQNLLYNRHTTTRRPGTTSALHHVQVRVWHPMMPRIRFMPCTGCKTYFSLRKSRPCRPVEAACQPIQYT